MAGNALPNTPMPGQTFTGSTSPRQLSRHGSASTPSHNNRYVGQPANPMRRSPERDAMLAATASRTNTPPRQMPEMLQNQFLGPQSSQRQTPERGLSNQPGPSGRPQPTPNILDTHHYLKLAAKNPPTPLSPHATPFFSTGQGQSLSNPPATRSQSAVNAPNRIPQSTVNTPSQDSGNGPNVPTGAQQAFNPYVNNNLQPNTSQPANQQPSSNQPETQVNTGPFQATNVHQNSHDQPNQPQGDSSHHQSYQTQGDTQTADPHNVHSFTGPQKQEQVQQRQQGPDYAPNDAPNYQQHPPNYSQANPYQDPSNYNPDYPPNSTNYYPPSNPQDAPHPHPNQQQPTPPQALHANTLNNLRSNTRLSSTHLPLPPNDSTLRKTEACNLLIALETDKKMLIRSRKKTYAEIRDLEELLGNAKVRRDAIVARKDWSGDELDLELAFDEGEGVRTPTPTMPAAMRAGVEPGFGAHGQDLSRSGEGPEGPPVSFGEGGRMSIGQQIFSLERELRGVVYYHEEYGRMYQVVGDNIEQMWEVVAQPEGGWEIGEE